MASGVTTRTRDTGASNREDGLPPPARGGHERSRGAWSHVARPLAIYAVSRVVTMLCVAVAATVVPEQSVRGALLSWDSSWYLGVVDSGYPHAVPEVAGKLEANRTAFFPLFPLAVRFVRTITGTTSLQAALIVVVASGMAAAVLVWRLVSDRAGMAAADRAVAMWCFFPGALSLSLVYPEGLMLALVAGCFLALARERWWLAGILAALATATRPNAIAVGAACAWAALSAVRSRREWRALAAPALAPLGLVAFLGFLWHHTGEPAIWLRTQRDGWGQRFDAFASVDVVRDYLAAPADAKLAVAVLGIIVTVALFVFIVAARAPAVFVVYAAAVMVPALVSQGLGVQPRFLLAAFPLLTVLGERLRDGPFAVVLGSSAALLGLLTVLSVGSQLAIP